MFEFWGKLVLLALWRGRREKRVSFTYPLKLPFDKRLDRWRSGIAVLAQPHKWDLAVILRPLFNHLEIYRLYIFNQDRAGQVTVYRPGRHLRLFDANVSYDGSTLRRLPRCEGHQFHQKSDGQHFNDFQRLDEVTLNGSGHRRSQWDQTYEAGKFLLHFRGQFEFHHRRRPLIWNNGQRSPKHRHVHKSTPDYLSLSLPIFPSSRWPIYNYIIINIFT